MTEVWPGYDSRQGVVLVSCENVDETSVSQNASTLYAKARAVCFTRTLLDEVIDILYG
jgi:hypothetical protein